MSFCLLFPYDIDKKLLEFNSCFYQLVYDKIGLCYIILQQFQESTGNVK